MIAGDTYYGDFYVQTAYGQPAPGLTSSSFGFDATINGATRSVTPTYAEVGQSADGKWTRYSFSAATSATVGLNGFRVSLLSGTNIIAHDLHVVEAEFYDLDSMASLLLTSQGVPAVQSAADNSLGDIVDGDSYKSATLTMPSGKLSPFSITDISAAGITVEAAIMASVGTTSYPITTAVVSGTDLTFTISWDTQQHPALSGADSKAWFIDVQVIKTGPPKLIVTPNRYSFQQVWQRDTRTT